MITCIKRSLLPMLVTFVVFIALSGPPACSWSKNDADTLIDLPRPFPSAHSPSWSPDGSKIIFAFLPLTIIDDTTYTPIHDSGGAWFIEPDGENPSFFLDSPAGPFDWHPNGVDLITSNGGTSLLKVNIIDTSITGVGYFAEGTGTAHYNVAGSKIILAADDGESRGVWIMDADGSNPRFLISSSIVSSHFDWSPDGQTIAYEDWDGGLSLIDTSGANIRQLVAGDGLRSSPAFAPDGSKIAFDMRKDVFEDFEIYTINCDGSGLKKLVTGRFPAWSPDGSKIAFVKYSYWGKYEEGNGQLWIMDSNGANQRQLTFVRE